jgi:hypothetical protein
MNDQTYFKGWGAGSSFWPLALLVLGCIRLAAIAAGVLHYRNTLEAVNQVAFTILIFGITVGFSGWPCSIRIDQEGMVVRYLLWETMSVRWTSVKAWERESGFVNQGITLCTRQPEKRLALPLLGLSRKTQNELAAVLAHYLGDPEESGAS